MLSPGVQLGNRYQLDERIASGGMGDVWRGTDQVLGRTVAVKSLLPALLDEPGFAERFRGEARTMATINHPGVVDIYDYGSDQQIAFLVMEYVEGDALSRTLSKVGRLTPARTMALVAQAADALHAAHAKGIVHRDVKPGNLLVRPNGTLVLTDFGIARSDMVGQLTAAGSVLGTASYISPEQASGAVATPASDVYALGVVAYQCLSGRRPFEGDNPLEIAMRHVRETPRPLPGDIPPSVRAIVERSLAKDPTARWPSAAALAGVARQAAAEVAHTSRSGPHRPSAPISGAPASPAAPLSARARVAPPQPATRPPVTPPQPVARPPATPPHQRPAVQNPVHPRTAPGHPTRTAGSAPVGAPRSPAVPPSQVGYPRGAAAVPQQPQPRQNPGYARPVLPAPPQAASSGNRPALVVIAIVLGALVVICSGMISYEWNNNNGLGVSQPAAVSSAGSLAGGWSGSPQGSYRQMERVPPAGGMTR